MDDSNTDTFKALHEVIHRFDVPEELLKRRSEELSNIDLDIQDERGNTQLMLEVLSFNPEAVELLLEHGANTEIENDEGETALILAITEDYSYLVELLCPYSDVNYKNMHGDSALAIAKYFEREDIIKTLVSYGALSQEKATKYEKDANLLL